MGGRGGWKREHGGALKGELIAAAVELLAERGVDALSLREVAARVGVTHAAAYHHFTDRTALLVEVANVGFRRLKNALIFSGGRISPGRLDAVVRAYLQFAEENAALFQVMFRPELVKLAQGERFEEAVALTRVAFDEAGDEVRAAAPGRAPGDWETQAWSLIHGLAVLRSTGLLPGTGRSLEDDTRWACGALIQPLLAATPRWVPRSPGSDVPQQMLEPEAARPGRDSATHEPR